MLPQARKQPKTKSYEFTCGHKVLLHDKYVLKKSANGVKELRLAADLTYSEIVRLLRKEFSITEEDAFLVNHNDQRIGADCFNLPLYVAGRKSNGKNRLYIATIG